MYFYSDDPAMDLIRYQAWQDKGTDDADEGRRCSECERRLGEYCYDVDGNYMCRMCFDDAFKVDIMSDDIICDDCGKPIDEDTGYKIDGVYFCAKCAIFNYRTINLD